MVSVVLLDWPWLPWSRLAWLEDDPARWSRAPDWPPSGVEVCEASVALCGAWPAPACCGIGGDWPTVPTEVPAEILAAETVSEPDPLAWPDTEPVSAPVVLFWFVSEAGLLEAGLFGSFFDSAMGSISLSVGRRQARASRLRRVGSGSAAKVSGASG